MITSSFIWSLWPCDHLYDHVMVYGSLWSCYPPYNHYDHVILYMIIMIVILIIVWNDVAFLLIAFSWSRCIRCSCRPTVLSLAPCLHWMISPILTRSLAEMLPRRRSSRTFSWSICRRQELSRTSQAFSLWALFVLHD